MRIALFILGTVAVIYLMVKGFKQVLQESREHQSLERDDTTHQQQLPQQRHRHEASDTHSDQRDADDQ